jgi:predicted DNA repair protein MutK
MVTPSEQRLWVIKVMAAGSVFLALPVLLPVLLLISPLLPLAALLWLAYSKVSAVCNGIEPSDSALSSEQRQPQQQVRSAIPQTLQTSLHCSHADLMTKLIGQVCFLTPADCLWSNFKQKRACCQLCCWQYPSDLQ